MAKKYTPSEKEEYMCDKHKAYFKKRLVDWKNEIIGNLTGGLEALAKRRKVKIITGIGEFLDNKIHGKGKMTYSNGEVYEGECKNNKINE